MAPEYVSGQEHNINDENEAPNPDPKSIRKKERPQRIVDQKTQTI